MRLGISTSLTGLNPHEWAEKIEKMGCRSVVFPVDCNAPKELIDEYVKEAKGHDLTIAEVGIWRNVFSLDKEEARKNMEYSIKQLELADYVEARCCVNVAGSFGPRWDGGYRENFTKEAFEKTVESIQHIIDAVKPQNTFFSIESMPWMIPTGPDEYLRLIEAVNRDRFGAHLDIINMINCPERYFFSDEFIDECFEKLGPYIKSCHLKDILLLEEYTFRLKECACGEGTFNFVKYMKEASKIDADMPMIIEHLKNDNEYEESVGYVLKAFEKE